MKSVWKRVLAAGLAVMMTAALAACGASEPETDLEPALQAVLERTAFDTPLSEVGTNAVLYFPDLPQGSEIRLYTGSGYFADEAALLKLPRAKDTDQAMQAVQTHLAELRSQFQNYVPEEVGKIDQAVTFRSGSQILLVITRDTETVQEILRGSASLPPVNPGAADSQTVPETVPGTTAAQTPAYPRLQSRSGTYHDYGNGVIRVDQTAFEQYSYVDSAAQAYAEIVNDVAARLRGKTTVYDMAIPTAVGVVLPDDIAAILPGYTDQAQATQKIYAKLSGDVVPVPVFDNLMQHRDEYLYFHTDYHWNGRGAYYAYEAFCRVKGVEPYPLEQRRAEQFSDFLGVLYWNHSGKDPLLGETPDTVEAFHPHSPNATMRYTDRKGSTYSWNIIMDVSDWDKSAKYSTFAAADNPIAVFQNPDVTDGSVAVVVKESYGNALLPYLVDHYSTIYELDYRYWEGNLVDFVTEKQADDLIFANNLTMIGSSFLIGKLAGTAK